MSARHQGHVGRLDIDPAVLLGYVWARISFYLPLRTWKWTGEVPICPQDSKKAGHGPHLSETWRVAEQYPTWLSASSGIWMWITFQRSFLYHLGRLFPPVGPCLFAWQLPGVSRLSGIMGLPSCGEYLFRIRLVYGLPLVFLFLRP